MSGPFALWVTAFVLLWGQAGPPPPPPIGKPPRPDPVKHIADIRRRIGSVKPVDLTAQRGLEYSRQFLASAESALRSNQQFRADRLAAAADSLLHVAEHQEHLREGARPLESPPAEAIQDQLQRVYFRTQQADYFFDQCHDLRARSLPQWARDFYQLAVRDSERKDFVAVDENAKSSDDIVRALESLAQAANVSDTTRPDRTRP